MRPTVPEDVIEMLKAYDGPAREHPPGWPPTPPRLPWPPFGEWPPDPSSMAEVAFGVLTGAFAEAMSSSAMKRVDQQCEDINRRIDKDNQGKEPGNSTPNIKWGGQVARLMGVNHGTLQKWRCRRPWRMQFGDFCRLSLIFGLRLEQMPPPIDPQSVLEQAYARATNWILLQFRDGRLPRPSDDEIARITEGIARFATAFAEDDAARAQAAAERVPAADEGDNDEEEDTGDDPNPRVTGVWLEFANGWLPPLRVQRQRNQLRSLVQKQDSQGILMFMQQQFDRYVRELLDNGDFASLLMMANCCTPGGEAASRPQGHTLDSRMSPVSEAIVHRLRQGEYADIAAEHLDAYEVLIDLLFLLPPLDPLGDDPVE